MGQNESKHSPLIKLSSKDCPFCEFRTSKKDILSCHIAKCEMEVKKLFSEIEKSHKKKLNTPIKREFKSISNSKLLNYPFSIDQSYRGQNRDFSQDLAQFKISLTKRKKDWRDGCSLINVKRQSILRDSIMEFKRIDIHKELKVNFIGEVSNDAGGILREWFSQILKSFYEENLFIKSDNDEYDYYIHPDAELKNADKYTFFGVIMAKALLENITAPFNLNKIIYLILLDCNIKLSNFVFVDKRVSYIK